jgi:hypothetical protein
MDNFRVMMEAVSTSETPPQPRRQPSSYSTPLEYAIYAINGVLLRVSRQFWWKYPLVAFDFRNLRINSLQVIPYPSHYTCKEKFKKYTYKFPLQFATGIILTHARMIKWNKKDLYRLYSSVAALYMYPTKIINKN